jgi:hypothetical protein
MLLFVPTWPTDPRFRVGFRYAIANSHNGLHNMVGGSMGTVASGYDPIFMYVGIGSHDQFYCAPHLLGVPAWQQHTDVIALPICWCCCCCPAIMLIIGTAALNRFAWNRMWHVTLYLFAALTRHTAPLIPTGCTTRSLTSCGQRGSRAMAPTTSPPCLEMTLTLQSSGPPRTPCPASRPQSPP